MLTAGERQRRYKERKHAEWAALPPVACECGCGTLIPPITKGGNPARFVRGHNRPGASSQFPAGHVPHNKGKAGPPSATKGKRVPAEVVAKTVANRRAKYGGRWTTTYKGAPVPRPPKPRQEAQVGPAHHGWKGGTGTAPYGPEFTKRFKTLIRERDGFKCRRCGVAQATLPQALHVHHIDFSKTNNDPANLVSLCPSCHRVVHPQVQARWDRHQ